MQIEVEHSNDLLFEVDELLLGDGDAPLVVDEADHAIVRGLHWLLEFGRHQRADDC